MAFYSFQILTYVILLKSHNFMWNLDFRATECLAKGHISWQEVDQNITFLLQIHSSLQTHQNLI